MQIIDRKPRVIIAKIGLDGHDRGAKIIARAFRDAGIEVIYSGLHNTADEIARIAVDEDVDAVGVSVLSGAHMTIFPLLLEKLKELSADEIIVFGGGIVPDSDIQELKKLGVKKIFTPGTAVLEIVKWFEDCTSTKSKSS